MSAEDVEPSAAQAAAGTPDRTGNWNRFVRFLQTPRGFAVVGASSVLGLVLILVVAGIVNRWEHVEALPNDFGHCIYWGDGACAEAVATWAVAVVSAFALVAAVVAGMYSKAAADEARELARHTARTAAQTTRLANIFQDQLAVSLHRCPTARRHLAIEPRCVLTIGPTGDLYVDHPPRSAKYETSIFEANRFERRGVFNFHVKATIVRDYTHEGASGTPQERVLSDSVVMSLGDVGEERVHFHIRAAKEIVDIQSVRVVFSDGSSIGDAKPGEEPPRIPVLVSSQRHKLIFGVIDVEQDEPEN